MCTTGTLFHSPVHDEAVDDDLIPERGLLTVSDEVWALAARRAEVIGPLAEAGTVGGEAVEAAAEQLGVPAADLCPAASVARGPGVVVSDLVPRRSSGRPRRGATAGRADRDAQATCHIRTRGGGLRHVE